MPDTDPYTLGKDMGFRDAVNYAGAHGLRAIAGRTDVWARGYADGYHAAMALSPARANGVGFDCPVCARWFKTRAAVGAHRVSPACQRPPAEGGTR